jgi:hypothetical protein
MLLERCAIRDALCACCTASQTQHRQKQNHLQTQHDATRFIGPACMALHGCVWAIARAELVPSFYRTQNRIRPHASEKAFFASGLMCFSARKTDGRRKSGTVIHRIRNPDPTQTEKTLSADCAWHAAFIIGICMALLDLRAKRPAATFTQPLQNAESRCL